MTIQQIAKHHKRTNYAILYKLVQEELIHPSWNDARGWCVEDDSIVTITTNIITNTNTNPSATAIAWLHNQLNSINLMKEFVIKYVDDSRQTLNHIITIINNLSQLNLNPCILFFAFYNISYISFDDKKYEDNEYNEEQYNNEKYDVNNVYDEVFEDDYDLEMIDINNNVINRNVYKFL